LRDSFGEPPVAAIQEEIRRLKQERDAALDQVRQLQEAQSRKDTATEQAERSEYEHQRQNQFLKAVLDNARSCIAVMEGPGLRYTLVNAAYQALRPGVKMEGRNFRQVFPGAVHSGAETLVKKVMETGNPDISYGFPVPIPGRPDAAWDHQIVRLPSEPDEEPSVLVIAKDVTDRVKAERELRESEERFHLAASAAKLGAYSLDLRTDEAYWSPEFLAIFGLEPDEPLPLQDGIPAAVHPEDRPRVLSESQARHQTTKYPEFYSEHRIIRPDGEIRWVLIRGRLEKKDEPLRSYGFAMDITDRKQAEEALQESEKRFRATFEQAAVGMAHVGLDGRFLRLNQKLCDIVGYSREELQKKTFMEITFAEDLDKDLAQATKLLHGEIDHYQMEKRYVHKAGHLVWVNLTGALQRSAEGKRQFYIAVIEDISERKAIEKELFRAKAAAEDANRAKSEFLANMSHEIRTPMTVFMAATEQLLYIDKNPDRRHLLKMADQSAKRLRALIDDILDFSRIEARRMDIEENEFDLRACVRDAVEMFTLPASEKSLGLETDVAPEIPVRVIGDPDRLGQVLINLIGNAVKFTHHGKIGVSVKARKGFLEFSVSDTGIGIPEDKRHLLFQSFNQVDSSFHRKYEGSGLGLAISRGLVELMGGKISVQSKEGEGSVFTFNLPLKTASENRRPDPVETPPDESFTENPPARILLVEDDPMIQELVRMILSREGWKTETAASGREAIEKWEKGNIDLILMDLQMLDMDGIEATRIIRQAEKDGKHTCIVGMTADARQTVEDKDQCLEAGMDDVLTKPVQREKLFSILNKCLAE